MYRLSFVFLLLLCFVSHASAETVKLPHDGLTLTANLKKVDGNWPEGPVFLMTHGTLAHGQMEIMSGLQNMLADRGFSSLSINLSLGLDQRSGMYDCATPHTHKHTDAVNEIGAWHQWLKQQGVQKIVLLGHSRGGNQTARYAAAYADDSVQAVFLIAPMTWDNKYLHAGYQKRYGQPLQPLLDKAKALVAAGKGEQMLENVGFIYCENTSASAEAVVDYYDNDADMNTPSLIGRINKPVVIFAGSADTTVANLIEKTEAVVDGDKSQLVVIDGADHFFRDLYSEDVADQMVEMLEQ
ncbi:MAG: alpha/beta hydrolase [Chromatiales bacterium]|jgi:pimeloyl-ACP methyl ester carboxylesterase